jgi:hypothetical protein
MMMKYSNQRDRSRPNIVGLTIAVVAPCGHRVGPGKNVGDQGRAFRWCMSPYRRVSTALRLVHGALRARDRQTRRRSERTTGFLFKD